MWGVCLLPATMLRADLVDRECVGCVAVTATMLRAGLVGRECVGVCL